MRRQRYVIYNFFNICVPEFLEQMRQLKVPRHVVDVIEGSEADVYEMEGSETTWPVGSDIINWIKLDLSPPRRIFFIL